MENEFLVVARMYDVSLERHSYRMIDMTDAEEDALNVLSNSHIELDEIAIAYKADDVSSMRDRLPLAVGINAGDGSVILTSSMGRYAPKVVKYWEREEITPLDLLNMLLESNVDIKRIAKMLACMVCENITKAHESSRGDCEITIKLIKDYCDGNDGISGNILEEIFLHANAARAINFGYAEACLYALYSSLSCDHVNDMRNRVHYLSILNLGSRDFHHNMRRTIAKNFSTRDLLLAGKRK